MEINDWEKRRDEMAQSLSKKMGLKEKSSEEKAYKYGFQDGAEFARSHPDPATVKLVEAVRLWKTQVDTHGGDYLPGHYQLIDQRLQEWEAAHGNK